MTASLLITALDVNANEHCPLLDVLYTVLCPSLLFPSSLFCLCSGALRRAVLYKHLSYIFSFFVRRLWLVCRPSYTLTSDTSYPRDSTLRLWTRTIGLRLHSASRLCSFTCIGCIDAGRGCYCCRYVFSYSCTSYTLVRNSVIVYNDTRILKQLYLSIYARFHNNLFLIDDSNMS